MLACALPVIAHAGLIRCDSRTITAQDLRRATVAARRAAGESKLASGARSVCMNPGRGRVWYEAIVEPQPDGSIVHPHIVCTRQTGPWSCEMSRDRNAVITVRHTYVTPDFTFKLPLDVGLEDARWLVSRAFELAPGLLHSQQCGWKPEAGRPDEGLAQAFTPGAFEPVESGWYEILHQEGDSLAVIVDGNGIVFTRAPGNGDWTFSCWSTWIVVA